YALEGLFSIKSDVYSFGVVILEIISGKKKHYECDHAISLLNYAWQLWKKGRPLNLMEQVLLESYNSDEVLKCIIVGLLCVQEDPDDRPNMSTVVTMLTSDIATLPEPKQPAFREAQWARGSDGLSNMSNKFSCKELCFRCAAFTELTEALGVKEKAVKSEPPTEITYNLLVQYASNSQIRNKL
nr:G-type lectin S-receptor-like serine/threonine-protein kinase At4g03230 [Tanacetum cinerariifolium]